MKKITDFIKKHYKKIIGIAVVCIILLGAYCYGGNAPDSRGFKAEVPENASTKSSEDAADEAAEKDTAANETEQESSAASGSTEEASDENAADDGIPDAEINGAVTSTTENNYDTKSTKEDDSASKSTTEETTTEDTTSKKSNKSNAKSKNTTEEIAEQASKVYTCTISINCSNILNNLGLLDESKTSCVPSDGWILTATEVEFEEGETVFDVLQKVTKENNIHLEYSYTALYGSAYIEGINNIYEFDCGELSGWEYSVNGSFPGYGCSKYVLSDGDVIRWSYTCDLGADVGNER